MNKHTISSVEKLAKRVFANRKKRDLDSFEDEMALQEAFAEAIDSIPGSLRSKAKQMGISAAHLSDVYRGKKAATQNMIDRLSKIGGRG